MPSLDDVTQRFTADTLPYIEALQAAAAAARDFADANERAATSSGFTAAAVRLLAEAVNSLEQSEMYASDSSEALNLILREVRDSSADLMMQTQLLSAGFDSMNEKLDTLIGHAAATREAVESLGDSFVGLAAKMALANTAASVSGAAAGLATGFWNRWGNVIHWVVAGGAEFLAVFIPAMVAAGGAAAVMAQGADDAWQRFQAMFAAQEAVANYIGTTTGQMVGMKSVLQQAQDAADPRIFELVGAGINIMTHNAGSFVQEGTQVLNILDNFAAKVTGELQGAFGKQLQGLLSGGAKDLQEFGAVLGNVGHALLNLAGDMPGLAHLLLDILSGFTGLINVLSSAPGIVITVAMAFEEFWRWGGLAATIITRLFTIVAGLVPALIAATQAIMGVAQAIMVAAIGGFATLIEAIGKGMVITGTYIAELGLLSVAEGEAAAGTVALGAAMSGAGASVVAFAAEIRLALTEMGPFMALIGLAGAVLLAFAVDKLATAKTATQEFTMSLQDAVEKSSGLNTFAVIADNFTKLATAEIGVANGGFAMNAALKGTYDSGIKYGAMAQAVTSATQALSAGQRQQQQDLENTTSAVGFLSKTYGTTFVGSMSIASAAGVNLANGITGTSNAADVGRLKIANYMAGMQMMGQSATTVGHDVTILGIDSQLTSTKVGQLNSAVDQFVTNMTGGTSNLGGLVESIANIGKVTINAGDALKGYNSTTGLTIPQIASQLNNFGQVGSQVWQNFDSALTGSGEQLADWFRTAGAEGAITSQQFTQGMYDIIAQFAPMAQKSKNAQNELVGFAQAQGLNIQTFPELEEFLKKTGAGMNSLSGLVGVGTKAMSDMNGVAQALAATVGTDVVSAMNSAKIAASGLGQSAENLASAWDHAHTINQQVVTGFQQTYNSLMSVYHNSNEAMGAVNAFAGSLGLTSGQVKTLDGDLTGLQGNINSLHGKTVTVGVQTFYTSSGAPPPYAPGAQVPLATLLHARGGQHGMTVGFAGGGMVGGGSGVDAIHAMLTAGEAVLNAQAVAALGGPLGVHTLNNQPSQGVLTSGGGGGGATALGLNLTVRNEMDGQAVNTNQRQATLIYNRRNPQNNLGLRTR